VAVSFRTKKEIQFFQTLKKNTKRLSSSTSPARNVKGNLSSRRKMILNRKHGMRGIRNGNYKVKYKTFF
jgi:hypothetical protein